MRKIKNLNTKCDEIKFNHIRVLEGDLSNKALKVTLLHLYPLWQLFF